MKIETCYNIHISAAEFKEYIETEKKGEATMDDLKLFLDKKYKMKESANA